MDRWAIFGPMFNGACWCPFGLGHKTYKAHSQLCRDIEDEVVKWAKENGVKLEEPAHGVAAA